MLVELGYLCENAIKLRKYMYLCVKYKLFCVLLIFYWCVMAVATLKKCAPESLKIIRSAVLLSRNVA